MRLAGHLVVAPHVEHGVEAELGLEGAQARRASIGIHLAAEAIRVTAPLDRGLNRAYHRLPRPRVLASAVSARRSLVRPAHDSFVRRGSGNVSRGVGLRARCSITGADVFHGYPDRLAPAADYGAPPPGPRVPRPMTLTLALGESTRPSDSCAVLLPGGFRERVKEFGGLCVSSRKRGRNPGRLVKEEIRYPVVTRSATAKRKSAAAVSKAGAAEEGADMR